MIPTRGYVSCLEVAELCGVGVANRVQSSNKTNKGGKGVGGSLTDCGGEPKQWKQKSSGPLARRHNVNGSLYSPKNRHKGTDIIVLSLPETTSGWIAAAPQSHP